MRKVTLPSGAELTIVDAPFADAKELYQAVLHELKSIHVDFILTKPDLWKNLFCFGFSSPDIERCLWKCLVRCLYQGEKILPAIFEPVERRQDFIPTLVEVAKENVAPFAKSLYAEFETVVGSMAGGTQESTSPTTSS